MYFLYFYLKLGSSSNNLWYRSYEKLDLDRGGGGVTEDVKPQHHLPQADHLLHPQEDQVGQQQQQHQQHHLQLNQHDSPLEQQHKSNLRPGPSQQHYEEPAEQFRRQNPELLQQQLQAEQYLVLKSQEMRVVRDGLPAPHFFVEAGSSQVFQLQQPHKVPFLFTDVIVMAVGSVGDP
jgi:hypothetical protein